MGFAAWVLDITCFHIFNQDRKRLQCLLRVGGGDIAHGSPPRLVSSPTDDN
jgi:hypothetical protein